MTAQVTVLGRLGRDVEFRTTQNGTAMAIGSVAVDKGFGDNKKTVWWKVIVFGKRAQNFFDFGKKGMLVAASGEFDLQEYTGKDGVQRQCPAVTASNVDWYNVAQKEQHQQAIQNHNARGNAAPQAPATSGYGTQPAPAPSAAQASGWPPDPDVPF